jgi:pantetheine-phosphate adenylyltransferase
MFDIAVYPGSFDPVTFGHIDLIQRAASQYRMLYVMVTNDSKKNYLFSINERKALLEATLSKIPNVVVESFEGLTVDYVANKGTQVMVRGLRSSADFDSELALAGMNQKLNSKIETVFFLSQPEHRCISSSAVKEVARLKGNLSKLVPVKVEEALKKKMSL